MIPLVNVTPEVEEAPDAELVRAIAAGGAEGRAAEAALWRRYAPRARLYGRKHLRDEDAAQDLVQHALVSVIEAARAGRVQQPERLGAFVLSTCRFALWDLRRGERRRQTAAARAQAGEPTALEPAPPAVDPRRLERCLRELPPRDLAVVRMSFCEDHSAEEIAEALALTAGNVRVVRHRALGRLQACLERSGRPEAP
jgi:RNA polymerase sigma-70 factor (ECF subfamily)